MSQSTTQHQEPIFWTSTIPNYSEKDRVRETFVDGKRIRERIPQRGHVGEYDNYDFAPGVRFVRVVRHDGHEVDSVLTNGAAHMDHMSPYGQFIQMKHRALGWFSKAECPCALVSAGHISAETLVHAPNREDQPCAPGSYSAKAPCPHARAEMKARKGQQADLMAEKEASYKTDQQRVLESHEKVVEGQNKIVELLAQREIEKGHKK